MSAAYAYFYYGVDIDLESENSWLHKPDAIKQEDWDEDKFAALNAWLKGCFGDDVKLGFHGTDECPLSFLYVGGLVKAKCFYSKRIIPENNESLTSPLIFVLSKLGATLELIQQVGWHVAATVE